MFFEDSVLLWPVILVMVNLRVTINMAIISVKRSQTYILKRANGLKRSVLHRRELALILQTSSNRRGKLIFTNQIRAFYYSGLDIAEAQHQLLGLVNK